ncbi:MAG TPA: DUF2203 domain-containing protein [Candidatus Nanoarchaeia archaeon]|nr:DUF2203 domain-containing protein [Candidatus Nanoarchaeia archaeon]
MPKHYLTVDHAQHLLPLIQKKMDKLRILQEAIDLLEDLEVEFNDFVVDYHYNLKIEKEYFRLQHEFYKILEELESVGCLVKDIEEGLVDFVHQHNGEDVFLCWKEGEQKVRFWHDIGEGYEERKPIYVEEDLEQ